MGVRGGIEYGFSSTTTDKGQALEYATGGMGSSTDVDQAMTIFEMQASSRIRTPPSSLNRQASSLRLNRQASSLRAHARTS